jgi:hypothetical protein
MVKEVKTGEALPKETSPGKEGKPAELSENDKAAFVKALQDIFGAAETMYQRLENGEIKENEAKTLKNTVLKSYSALKELALPENFTEVFNYARIITSVAADRYSEVMRCRNTLGREAAADDEKAVSRMVLDFACCYVSALASLGQPATFSSDAFKKAVDARAEWRRKADEEKQRLEAEAKKSLELGAKQNKTAAPPPPPRRTAASKGKNDNPGPRFYFIPQSKTACPACKGAGYFDDGQRVLICKICNGTGIYVSHLLPQNP